MFEQTKYAVNGLPGGLYDLCLTPSDRWIAVTKHGDGQCLSFTGDAVPLPEPLRFPHVTAIDEETVLIVDLRAGRDRKNAWIINEFGEIKSNFYAGDAIQDVVVTENFSVITYFDESALTSDGIEGNGLAVFDLEGNYQFGYRELFSTEAIDIADCYCAVWVSKDRVLFFPYTNFPLVSFDLKRRSQQIWETPPEVAGSHALTSVGADVYFYGPYADKSGIYKWTVGMDRAKKVDESDTHLRGLSNGRFLAVDGHGYRILSLLQ